MLTLHSSVIYNIYLCIMKEKILKLLDDDQELSRFTEVLLQQIDNDDEPWEDKGRQILLAALNDDKADDFFIAICGYSLKSLLDMI